MPDLSGDTGRSFFPIMAWGHAPGDLDVLKEMAECGITVAGFVAPGDLDLVAEVGLRAFVYDQRASGYDFRNVDAATARRNAESLAREVGDHPVLLGVYIKDEPHADEFPGLATVTEAFKEAMPGRIPYINLFPNYASQTQLGTSTYTEYLDRYVATVRPPFISYDHYAMMEYEPLRKGYFANLEAVRACAQANGLPFWNIVLSNAHYQYREPTAADIRFQAFTTLAYGGQGVSYFTYFTPPIGNYRMAPIDQFGHRTPTWSYLQHVNLQLLNLTHTYFRLRSQRVYHVAPEALLPEDGLLATVEATQTLVMGEFEHEDGSPFVLLVNRDLVHSTHFRVVPRETNRRVEQVSPYSGQIEPLTGENDWLAPGQGVLLRLGSDQ